MRTVVALLYLLLLPAVALAQGDQHGGGGDVVICSTPIEQHGLINKLFGRKNRTDYYLLDVYEAMKTSGKTIDLGGPNLSVYEKIELIRQDFAKLDPFRADKYADEAIQIAQDLDANEHGISTYDKIELIRKTYAKKDPARAESFAKEALQKTREKLAKSGKLELERSVWGLAVMTGTPLVDILDADDQYKFDECLKYQLVRQEESKALISINAPTYEFNKKYWRKLNTDNKVATLFHEVIYKEFRRFGATNSRTARTLNAYLFSRSTASLPLSNYLAFLASVGTAVGTNSVPKEYFFQSNVGKVRLLNFYADRWSATVTPDGLITEVSASFAKLNLVAADFRFSQLPLNRISSYSFNLDRQLTGITGVFSFSYDDKLIRDFNANCFDSALNCVTGTSIRFLEGGTMQMETRSGALVFDLDGKLLAHP
jgi:hypothetical protein